MKITIENIPEGNEAEIMLRCSRSDEYLIQLIYSINTASKKLIGIKDMQTHIINQNEVFYFESVDNKVFIYCKEKVFESKLKLYEIEEKYEDSDFFRATKSTILNISKIEAVSPVFYGRLEALLKNGEKVYISRQYVPEFKRKLGL